MGVERLGGGIGVGVELGERGQCGVDDECIGLVDGVYRGDRHRAFGDGAGLVGAEHVDAGEHFDRRQLLHQTAVASEAHHTHCERNAGEQHQALRHHADETGDGADDALLPADVTPEELAAGEQQAHRDDHVTHPGDDAVDVVAQGRVDEREPAGFFGQLGCVVLGAHLGDQHSSCAGHHRAAAEHVGADRLHRRVGLAGEERLVDLQVVAGEHRAVGHHLRAAAQLHHVVLHQFVNLQLDHLPVAHCVGAGRVDHAQLVEHALGAQLLHDTDDAVGDDDAAEQGVLRAAGRDHERGEDAHDEVDRCEHVGPHDLPHGARGRRRDRVAEATSESVGDLRSGEADGRVGLALGHNVEP